MIWIYKKINTWIESLKKARNQAKINRINLDYDLKTKEIEMFEKEHQHYKNKIRLSYLKNLKNTKILDFILFVMILGSTTMSIAGLKGFAMLTNKDSKIVFVGAILCIILTILQALTFYGSSIFTYVEKNFNIHAKKLKLIPMCLLPISILGNFNFLRLFVIPFEKFEEFIILNIINVIIVLLICIVYDVTIITFVGYRNDKKYLLFTYKNENDLMQENTSILQMLNFLIWYKLKAKLKIKYLNSLNQYKKILNQDTNYLDKETKTLNNKTNSLDNLTKSLDQNENGLDNEIFRLDKNKKSLDSEIFELDHENSRLDKSKKGLDKTRQDNESNTVIPIDFKESLDKTRQFENSLDKSEENIDKNKNILNKNKNGLDKPEENIDKNKNSLNKSEKNIDKNKNGLDKFKDNLDKNKNGLDNEENIKMDLNELKETIKTLIEAEKDNEEIKPKNFINVFNLTTPEWRKIRNWLIKENIIYTKDKKSFKSPSKVGSSEVESLKQVNEN